MEMKYGVLTGIFCVVFRSFEFFMGWPDSNIGQYSAYIGILMMAAGAYYCVRETRTMENGQLSFGKSFMTALTVCFIISIMIGAHAYVYNSTVAPERKEVMVKEYHQAYKKEGKTEEEMKVLDERVRLFFSPMSQLMSEGGGTIIAGLFVSLVIAGFTRTRKPE